MAESPAITEGVLKMKITELLQALHVEIEDMSGISPSLYLTPPPQKLDHKL
jgi:hypothetical protein